MGLYDEQSKHLEDGDSAYFEGLELDILQRATSNDGSSLLTVAALKGQVNCCRVICERCPQLLYQTNRSGRTAMHVAASHGKEEVIKFLQVVEQERVDAKSIVEEEIDYKLSMMQDHLGNTALHLAAQGGHYPSANLLLDADPSSKLLGMVNNDGETALHVAVKYVRFEIVKLLVQDDPDFEYSADKSGHIPIFIAFNMALSGDEEKVKIRNLLIRRQRGQCMHKNEIGRTLLHHATYKNNIPTVMEILDSWKECSEMVDDKDGNFLHLAVWLEHKELIELILDSKKVSDKVINGKNDNGETPLHIAILTENRHLILTLLYNERVKKTIPNKQGNNVLNSIPFGYDKRRAGLYGWEELKDHRDFKGQSQNTYDEQFKRVRDGHIVYFMRLDLDILKNAKSNDGSSLLSYAAREGDLICCQVIYIRCPQLLYQTNSSRSTALHAAVMSFTPESIAIVKFLLAVDQEEKLPMMQDMHGHTFFHLAVEKFYFNKIIENLILIWNHADLVKKLLGVVNYKGETTLHLAVQSNHKFSIELLIKVDPDFEYSADDSGNTPILAAAKMAMSGDEERVKIRRFLIKNQHAQCRLPVGNNKWTLLHHAAHEGDLGTIKDIIDLWPDCCKLLDEEGQNFLHLAVRSGQVEVVKYIFELENIEDNVLNGTDKCGNTPWHFIPPSKIDGIALFIRDNSRVDVMAKNMEGKTILDEMGIGVSGWTLLHYAARNGDMVAIEEIIKSNPDCCNVVNEDNQNFIHLAAMYDKIAVVKFGLELATLSKEVLNAMDIHGNTPLHVARSCGYTHIASTLIQDSRVDTTIENKRKIIAQNMGRSVLFQRASKGDAHFFMEVQEDMLLNSRDEDGESLLSIAARDGHFNCCKVICERCSRLLYQTNKNGVSALHRATSNASGNIIKYLLGVEVKMKQQGLQNHGRVAGEEETNTKILGLIDNNKDTAMHYAVRSHNFMIVQLLLNADPAFKYSDNKSGYTPAFLALQGIHSDHGSIVEIGRLFIQNSCEHRDEKGQTLLHHATSKHDLKPNDGSHWLVWGDLNCILSQQEKRGGTKFQAFEAQPLINLMDAGELLDVKYKGKRFTWDNKQDGWRKVLKRLDRVLLNAEASLAYPDALAQHIPTMASDHSFVFFQFQPHLQKQKPCFHFEAMWLQDDSCRLVVKESFSQQWRGSKSFNLCKKLNDCKYRLRSWNRNRFGNFNHKIAELQDRIDQLHQQMEDSGYTDYGIQLEQQLIQECDYWLDIKDKHWAQKARLDWRHLGERNTRFFHLVVTKRRKFNRIDQLKLRSGVISESREEIGEELVHYFSDLFTSELHQLDENLLSAIPQLITVGENDDLLKEISTCEIRDALKSIGDFKAPGPDGFNAYFFKQLWDEIGESVAEVVHHFFENGTFASQINYSHLVLIPKCQYHVRPEDHRHISLLNVTYKIITKIMVSRMKPILQNIIGPQQSAFMKGRSIHDNILIAKEVSHKIYQRPKKNHYFGLKLDMQKAYDRIEWDFIREVMTRFGFCHKWIDRVMFCITTASFSIKLNGREYGYFKPSRGIRQGDPLSPYLFILCAEVLSLNLQKKQQEKVVVGVELSPTVPAITHLMYADDTLLFGKVSLKEAHALKSTLNQYCAASGQKINLHKSQLVHNKALHPRFQRLLHQIFKVPCKTRFSKYLGAKMHQGRITKESYQDIINRYHQKLASWKSNTLSKVGRVTLDNAVLAAVPSHTMAIELYPVGILEELDVIRRGFLWNHREDQNKKLHYFNWDLATSPKPMGGLGLRDLQMHNLALFGKKAWELIKGETLWAKIMKGIYFKNKTFMTATKPRTSSSVWKHLLKLRPLMRLGMGWKIGDGIATRAWKDAWIPTKEKTLLPKLQIPQGCPLDRVVDFFIPGTRTWDRQQIFRWWPQAYAKHIMAIQLSLNPKEDEQIWLVHKNGKYTVKSAYEAMMGSIDQQLISIDPQYVNIWKLKVTIKIQFFLWQLLSDSLPVHDKLIKQGFHTDNICHLCDNGDDNVLHFLFSCPLARAIWLGLGLAGLMETTRSARFQERWKHIQDSIHHLADKDVWMIMIPITLWFIWICRNEAKFQKKKPKPEMVILQIKMMAEDMQRDSTTSMRELQEEKIIKWSAPPPGKIKMNTDGSSLGNPGAGGASCVFRDEKGYFLIAAAQPLFNITNFMAEAIAVRIGLQIALKMQYSQIIIEMDSQALAHSISCDSKPSNDIYVDDVLQDIKRLLQEFHWYEIQWIYREANGVADKLAKETSLLATLLQQGQNITAEKQWLQESDILTATGSIWLSPPTFLNEFLANDCNELVDKNGENFLHLATRLGYNTIVEYIVGLKDLSKEFFNRKNNNKETPLHIAISSGNQNVALSLLYEHRVNKWILDKHGKNVLKAIRFDYDKRQAEVFGFMDEKELKDQSEFDLLVGALITTVAFTAGITVPGGFIPDGPNRGNAILHRKPTFEVFVVSNTIALALSLFAVFTHFCMKSLDETETVIQLKVAKFCSIGSIYALMVAFVMGSFSVLSISLRLAIIVTGICCCFFGCSFYSLWRMRKNRQKYRRQFN